MLRHIRWQVTLIAVGAAVLAGLMIYLALSFSVRFVPAPGGTYIEGVVGQPQFLNPLLCSFNPPDTDICSLVFNGLVKFDQHGLPQPGLAQRWTISTDDENYGKIYTFYLRNDVTWHDGQPFTADDVIFTIQLLQDPTFPGRPDIGALWRTVEAVKIDNYTVQLTLPEPFAPFLDYLSIGILPAHVLHGIQAGELVGHPFNRQPVGTGPFRVKAFVNEPGSPPRLNLETNGRYFGRQPYINEVEFKYYPTIGDVFDAYRAGEVQGIARVEEDDLGQVRATPSLNLFTAPISGLSLVFLNTGDPGSPFFQEQEVRRALLLALDRQLLVDGPLAGQGIVADSPFLPTSWAYDPDTQPIRQDLSAARRLLNEAGWLPQAAAESQEGDDANGDAGASGADIEPENLEAQRRPASADALRFKAGVPLSFTLMVSADQVDVAHAIANQWRAIGVQATVQPVQVGLASNFLQARQYQAAVANILLDTPDPDPYPFWHETKAAAGQNYSQFKDRDMSEVLEAARRVVEPDRRAALYHKFAQMFRERVPSILLYYPVYSYAVNERIRDVQVGPMWTPADRLQTIADWFVIERRVIANTGQFAP